MIKLLSIFYLIVELVLFRFKCKHRLDPIGGFIATKPNLYKKKKKGR